MKHMSRDDATAAVEQFEARRLVENSRRSERIKTLLHGLISETLAIGALVALWQVGAIAWYAFGGIVFGWCVAKIVATYIAGRVTR